MQHTHSAQMIIHTESLLFFTHLKASLTLSRCLHNPFVLKQTADFFWKLHTETTPLIHCRATVLPFTAPPTSSNSLGEDRGVSQPQVTHHNTPETGYCRELGSKIQQPKQLKRYEKKIARKFLGSLKNEREAVLLSSKSRSNLRFVEKFIMNQKHISKTKNYFKVISYQPHTENQEVLWRKIIINHMVYAIHTMPKHTLLWFGWPLTQTQGKRKPKKQTLSQNYGFRF